MQQVDGESDFLVRQATFDMTEVQRNYSNLEKEMLAVAVAAREF